MRDQSELVLLAAILSFHINLAQIAPPLPTMLLSTSSHHKRLPVAHDVDMPAAFRNDNGTLVAEFVGDVAPLRCVYTANQLCELSVDIPCSESAAASESGATVEHDTPLPVKLWDSSLQDFLTHLTYVEQPKPQANPCPTCLTHLTSHAWSTTTWANPDLTALVSLPQHHTSNNTVQGTITSPSSQRIPQTARPRATRRRSC